MARNEIIEKANVALEEEFEVAITENDAEAIIKEHLELDSLALVDMVALLESTFSVKIKGTEITSVKTFNDLYGFLEGKMN